jgi:hypothetical protein
MTNKVVKKVWLQITDLVNFWTITQIETDEDLKKVEKFINGISISNSIATLKTRLFWEKIAKNTINVISWTENKILNSWFEWERKEIPTKIAVNLIENASLEDWEKLQDIWSNMLANAVTGKVDIKNSYIDILRQLTESEVKFLDFLFNNIEGSKLWWESFDIKNQWFSKSIIINVLELTENNFELIVDSLLRLNLVHTWQWDNEDAKDNSYNTLHMKRWLILLTCLGYEFIKACKFS